MLWKQFQFCRRILPPSLNSSPSSQAAYGLVTDAMKASHCLTEKALRWKDDNFRYPPFPYSREVRSLPASHTLSFGSLQHTSCSLTKNLSPLEALMDSDVVRQHALPSPTPAGDILEEFYPTLLHSSSFLQTTPPEREEQEPSSTYTLVILNHKLPLLTLFLWSQAYRRICADGGANQIYDCIPRLFPHEDSMILRKRYKPDVIKGDLDSIRPEVKEFYSSLGTTIINDSEDQDTTDLWKCVAYAIDSIHEIKTGQMKLLVLGALGGRLDHEFANLNTLYLFKEARIILLTDESMAFLLPRGYKHELRIDLSVEGPYCGLLPLGGPSLCTTTKGLKWDLNKTSLQFGGLISTSNMPTGDCVMVSSDADLVWTINLQHLHTLLKERVGLATDQVLS